MSKEAGKGTPTFTEKVVTVGPGSSNEYGIFLGQAKSYLESRLQDLKYISRRSSHGRQRPKREISDLELSRRPEIETIESALKILSGKNPRKIKFLVEGGPREKILGFQILGPNSN